MKKIYQLEGVRGFGALLVFVCHFQIVFYPGFYDRILGHLTPRLPGNLSRFIVYMIDMSINGNMFLHIFWALSAYVLLKKYFENNTRGETLAASSIKRYVRLMIPCTVSVFFSYFLFKFGLIYVRGIHVHVLQQNLYAIPPSIVHSVKTSFWNNLFDYDYFNSYNGPLWTIQREFMGSLFCFGLFGVIGKAKRRSLLYVIIFGCVFTLKMYWLNSFLLGYFLADYDFSEENRNGKLYQWAQAVNRFAINNQMATLGLFVIVFVTFKSYMYKHPDDLDMINCILSFLVIFISLRLDAVNRLAGISAFTWLGRVSFGLYVLHWPFMCAYTSWFYLSFPHTWFNMIFLFASTLGACLLMAKLFYKYVDLVSIKVSGRIAGYFSNSLLQPLTRMSLQKASLFVVGGACLNLFI
jgi:peptidoglycan/LPS O-acetylase OafA/YrhL